MAAVDDQDRIILSAFSQGTKITLTAESTAYAMARTLVGAPPAGIDERTWEEQIRAFPQFSALVVATDLAVRAGRVPEDDLEIASALLGLVSAVNGAVSGSPAASIVFARPAAGAVMVDPRIDRLPFTALSDSFAGATFSVRVTKAFSDGSIEVTNSTPLYWAISSQTSNGSKLPIKSVDGTPRIVGGAAILDGLGYGTALIEGVDNWLLKAIGFEGQKAELPGSPSQGFDLVIEQSDEAFSLNLVKTVDGLIGQVLTFVPIPASKCSVKFVKAALPDEKLAIFVQERSVTNFKSYLTSNAIDWNKALKECAPELKVFDRYIAIYWKHLNVLINAVDAINKAEKGLTAFARLRLLAKHSTSRYQIGVCQAKHQLFGFTVSSCADTLSVEPFVDQATGAPIESPTLLPRAQLRLALTAKDALGESTLVPSSLVFSNANPAGAEITVDESGVATVRALSAPGTAVSVRDLATDAETVVQIKVQPPRVVASKTTLGIREQSQVRLVDSLGQTMFADGVPVVWRSSDESKIAVVPFFGSSSSRFVNALAVTNTPVIIRAINSETSEEYGSVSLSVTDSHRFEFKDQESGRDVCVQRTGQPDVVFFLSDSQFCRRYVIPTVTCIGGGCSLGRFYISPEGYQITQLLESFPVPGGTVASNCGPIGEFYDARAQTGGTSTFPGHGWHPINGENRPSFMYPTGTTFHPSISGFPLDYSRNFSNMTFIGGGAFWYYDPALAPTHSCARTGYDFHVTAVIYDSLLDRYERHAFSLSLPAR